MSTVMAPLMKPSMRPWSARQLLTILAIGIAAWMLVALLCFLVGSTAIGWPTHDQRPLRLEPILLASLIGAALAAAGCTYQAILRNPLADPYLLGVSSGASLSAYLWQFIATWSLFSHLGALSQQAFAFAGALAAVACVFAISTRRGRLDPVTLLLVGVIVSSVCGSIFLLINALHPEATAGSGGPMDFLVGGIRSNLELREKLSAGVVVFIGWLLLLLISPQLNVAVLSEHEAESLGVRIHRLRWLALIIASLITADAVAISGPIAFIGLICPHLSRQIVGPDQRRLLPTSTFCGAILLALADAAIRLLSQQGLINTVLPVGVLTGMMGGPFFLYLLWRQRRP
jgi:iron complex transport system permease protein